MWSLLIASVILADPTPPLDAQAIAASAANTSPSVRAALASVERAGAGTHAIDQRFWPRVTTTARYTRLSYNESTRIAPPDLPVVVEIPGATSNQLAVGVGVALPLSDWLTRWDEAKAAGRHAEAAERALVEVARQKAAADALGLWYAWQRAGLGIEVASAALADAEAHLSAANVLVKAEVASIADVRLAEAGVAAARLDVDKMRHAQALAASVLTTMLHRSKDQVALAADLDARWPMPTDDRMALLSQAQAARPEAVAIAEGEAALGLRREVIAVDRWPRLDVVANAQLANPSPRGLQNVDEFVGVWDASAVLTWRLNAMWEADTAEHELAAETMKLSADREALADGIAFEVDQALSAIADADASASASEAMIAAALEGHRVRAKAYALGKASSVDLSEAEAQLTRARLGAVNATIDRRVGELRLAHALGIPLTN